MKITELQLEQYGIYHNVSWRPYPNQLNVVMGVNESGKTTLLHFIRDMIFGFRRGRWQGRKGSMSFVRSDGSEYRVFRDGKKSWFEDAAHNTYHEELPNRWWHGLTRSMYEQIFALGLEDLQGASFLSKDAVRSRFFMMQGGDQLSGAKKIVDDQMESLMIASPQGKRKINQLMADLSSVNQKLDSLSHQEIDFSNLQKKQIQLKNQIAELKKGLQKDNARAGELQKQLGAWKYYEKASQIKRQLDLSSDVQMFPANGKEQWNQLMNRMKVIHDQKEALQPKIDAYQPKKKEDVVPLSSLSRELDKLYVDLGQWRQLIQDMDELQAGMANWKITFSNLGYELPLWDRLLTDKDRTTQVDWTQGRRLAQAVDSASNELHFWKQREPEVEELPLKDEKSKDVITEDDWKTYEGKAQNLEKLVQRKAEIIHELTALSKEEDKKYSPWFWMGAASLILAVAGIFAFYFALAGYVSLYGTVIFAILASLFFLMNNHAIHRKGRDIEKNQVLLNQIEQERTKAAADFPDHAPVSESDLDAFHHFMQVKRNQFYKQQAEDQADAWKMETVKKQQKQHKDWDEEGKQLKKVKEKSDEAWTSWLKENHLPYTEASNIADLQSQWQRIFSEEGRGKIFSVHKEKIQAQLDQFNKQAENIIRAAHKTYPVSPDSIAEIYEENRQHLLEWSSIEEKNKQHDAYMQEKKKLDDAWAACEKEMNMLLGLVHAKNAEEFAEKVNAHEHRGQIQKEWETVKQDLRLYAGGDQEFDRLWKTLSSGQYDEWMKEYKELKNKTDESMAALGNLQKQEGAVENEILRLAGDNSITDVLQKRDNIEARLNEAMTQWVSFKLADSLLEKTQDLYEAGKRPRIITKANEFLQEMTQGKYSLIVSDDGKDVSIVDSAHHVKESSIWSSGTGDQVYLAIRLAMALSFGEQIEPLPIVLDDIFVRFDEIRQRETLKFLMKLGQMQQIFLFTCHEQTMRIAEEIGTEMGTGSFIHLEHGQVKAY